MLDTPRGTIEIELFAGDAPLGLDHFRRVVESGEIIGIEFGRVVPNFVVQQRAIRNDITLRDEVNRRGLNRGTLAWASSGLDTGRPGYTLGNTPQPHNEGDFTALGRVVAGIEVVDRLELGDAFTGGADATVDQIFQHDRARSTSGRARSHSNPSECVPVSVTSRASRHAAAARPRR